jgi:RimJ/RimL family protein N-acetyltransferase
MGVTAAFTLRQLQLSDAPRIAELFGDWEVVRWLSSPPYPYTLRDAEEYLATAIVQHSQGVSRTEAILVDGQLSGAIGIEPNSRGLNLGYWLARPYWRRGIVTAAATALTRDFFARPEAERLTSGYFSGNEASWAIQRRLGFVPVAGDGKLYNRVHGTHLPHVETALSRPRWEILQRTKASADKSE